MATSKPPKVPGAAPASRPAPAADASTQDGDLPNAIDVDASAIKAPVLTRQGWVVPPGEANPNAPR